MSSGFVSGGTVDNPTERDDEWRQAQAELEAARKAKADLAAQHNGKSLFEILQENKDKKQAEFEEKARYKLHVSLNDDEADYLDAIAEEKRKEEDSVRKDTREQLEAFRRQQEDAERKALDEESTEAPREDGVQWGVPGRKRKKRPETSLLKGVKLRKSSSVAEEPTSANTIDQQERTARVDTDPTHITDTVTESTATTAAQPAKARQKSSSAEPSVRPSNPLSLGLGYASSEDDS